MNAIIEKMRKDWLVAIAAMKIEANEAAKTELLDEIKAAIEANDTLAILGWARSLAEISLETIETEIKKNLGKPTKQTIWTLTKGHK